MESKYTPGPWKVVDYNNCIAVECNVNGAEHTVVTDQFCYPNFKQYGDPEKLANAKLIAAAPELLEVLKELQNWHIKYPTGKTYPYDMIATVEGELTAIVHKAEAAILKATSI